MDTSLSWWATNKSTALSSPSTLWSYTVPTPTKQSFMGMSVPGALLIINIMVVISVVFFGWTKAIQYAVDKNTDQQRLIDTYKSIVTTTDSLIWYPGISQLIQEVSWPITSSTFSMITNSSVPYVFKRDLIEEKIFDITQQILRNTDSLSKIQEEVIKYGFIHQDIMSLFDVQEDTVPITSLLKTIETIKFGTAFKIFSLLDTFLSQSSRLLWINKNTLAQKMDSYSKRGEKDIDHFLTTCYLNPYEKLPDCNNIWDFANYFRYDNKDSDVDPTLLSNILVIINNKLEQSEIPSLQIAFDNFSPHTQSLGFDVTINTLPEDESIFLEKGILNPHIFIISTLVNLLRQSLVVIWESINVNKLNIKPKILTVGDIKIPVNTSSMKFNLPLQSSSQREIYDFFNFDAPIDSWKNENISWSDLTIIWELTWVSLDFSQSNSTGSTKE